MVKILAALSILNSALALLKKYRRCCSGANHSSAFYALLISVLESILFVFKVYKCITANYYLVNVVSSVNLVVLYKCILSFLLEAPEIIIEFREGTGIGVISTVISTQAMGFV